VVVVPVHSIARKDLIPKWPVISSHVNALEFGGKL